MSQGARRWIAALGMTLGAAGAWPLAAAAQEGGSQTLRGEIVDPAGYLKDGKRGPDVVEETYEAVDGGQSLALLAEDGTLYLQLAEQPGEDPSELAYDYVNQPVAVTGPVYERPGLRGIVPLTVEPLTPAEPAPASQEETPSL